MFFLTQMLSITGVEPTFCGEIQAKGLPAAIACQDDYGEPEAMLARMKTYKIERIPGK